MSKLKNPWGPDPKLGWCHQLGRWHSVNDKRGNKCTHCGEEWKDKK